MTAWPTLNRLRHLQTKWLTLIGAQLQDEQGQIYEYWRIEKADAAMVVPRYRDAILPPPAYRPGLGRCSLDWPGGAARPIAPV